MMAKLDLPAEHLELLRRILTQHVPDAKVMAFGSRVQGRAKPHSDIDLAIIRQQPIDWRTLARLKEAFEESDLPICVDLVDWQNSTAAFKQAVEARGWVVVAG